MSTLHRQHGLTLLEVMIVVSITTIIVTALLRFLSASHPLSKVTFLQAQSTETARLQLKRLAKTMRETRASDTGAYPLVEMSPQRIIFFANIDSDASVERVRYELSGTNLQRGVIKPTGNPLIYDPAQEQVITVAGAVRNDTQPLFIYYGGNYPADTTPLTSGDLTEVKYLEFHLIIDIDPAIDPAPIEVISQVQLRNLKTNLGETVP